MYNFGAYSGVQEIVFANKKSDGSFITIIGGLNGRGKTSILEAILLVLYGNRSPRYISSKKSYGSYLMERIHGRGTIGTESWLQIELEFAQNNIKIKRSWKKNKRMNETIQVWVNDIEDPYFSNNIESFIEEFMPAAIAELFFFDGEKINTLAESDETEDSVKKAIQSLLGIEIVDRLIRDLELFIRKKKGKQKKSSESDILHELLEATDKLRSIEDKKTQFLQSKASVTSKINHLVQVIERIRSQHSLSNVNANQENINKRRDELQNQIDEIKVNIGTLVAGVFPLVLVENQLKELKEVIQEEKEKAQAKTSLGIIKNISREILSSVKKSNVDEITYKKIEELFLEKVQNVEKKADARTVFPLGLTMSNQMEQVLETLYFEKDQGTKIVEKFNIVERELDQIESNIIDKSEIDVDDEKDLQLRQKEIELQMIKLEQDLSIIQNHLKQIDKEEALLKSCILDLSEKKAEMDENERIIKYAAKTLINMKNFKGRLSEKKLNKLSEHIYEAFSMLTHKSKFISKIVVDHDAYNVKLFGHEGVEVSKQSLSSGERQMLALSILWGLAKASGKKLPVVIDSPLGRLDSLHRNKLVETYLPNASHQVVILSTDTEISGLYFEKIKPYTGKKYILSYDEETKSTSVEEGYF